MKGGKRTECETGKRKQRERERETRQSARRDRNPARPLSPSILSPPNLYVATKPKYSEPPALRASSSSAWPCRCFPFLPSIPWSLRLLISISVDSRPGTAKQFSGPLPPKYLKNRRKQNTFTFASAKLRRTSCDRNNKYVYRTLGSSI